MTRQFLDVTVVIPCYNRWPHIQKAIDSVLNQTYRETYCLVVDDASTDGTYEALEEAYQGNPRVAIFRLLKNQGQSAARNFGAQHVRTQLVCFLDSDDILFADAVSSRIKLYHDDSNFHGISFGQKEIAGHDNPHPDDRWRSSDFLTLNDYLSCKDLLHTNTFMMFTEDFIKSGGFDTRLRNQEDIELFLRLLTKYEARYSGAPCCRIETVDNQRARHDLKRIIEQGSQFSTAVTGNQELTEKASPELLQALLEHDLKVT